MNEMSMNENIVIDEKLVIENTDFIKAVVGAKSIEEAQSICAEYNIELPEEAWREIQDTYRDGELSEDDLSAVSGGKLNGNHLLSALAGIAGLGATIAAGSALGVLVACAWIGYHAYKTFR
jgi:hypothetical protein